MGHLLGIDTRRSAMRPARRAPNGSAHRLTENAARDELAAFSFGIGRMRPPPVLSTAAALQLLIANFFIFLSWFSLFSQVIMVEGLAALAAFDRSKELSEGYRLRILGLWLLLFVVLQMVVGGGVGLVLGTFFPTADVVQTQAGPTFDFNIPNVIINQVISFPVNAVVITYTSVCMTLLYFDLRIRKEGFDLEIAAQRFASHDDSTPLD